MLDYEIRKRFNTGISEKVPFPQTYIVIEFSHNVRRETAQWIVDKIQMESKHGGAELLVCAQPPIEGQNFTIHVSAEESKLLELGEDLGVRKRDRRGILREFSMKEIDEFTKSFKASELLTLSEKQVIVRHELENIRALENEAYIPGYPSTTLYEGQSIISSCLHYGIVKQLYPLHDLAAVQELGKSWYMPLYSKQPHEKIRLYFGESIALYFQFLGFYTYALVVPMVLGFIQLFLPSEYLTFFCVFNIITATLFLELWRRKCAELAFSWGTISMTSLDEPRPNFRGVMGKDQVTDRMLPQYPRWKTNAKMYCISLPLVILCMFGAFLVMLVSFWAEDFLKKLEKCPVWLTYVPSTTYAALIYLMNLVYRWFANFLTEWENHRTQSQFDRHRVTKLVLFEFVNNFMSLFYIAFIVQDLEMLRSQLATLLIILQALNNIQEAALPLVIRDYSQKMKIFSNNMRSKFGYKLDFIKKGNEEELLELPGVRQLDPNDTRIKQVITEGNMEQYEDPYDDYLELFVQFGYVFLFSSVYPMAAFWSVFNNCLEIRSDAFKLCCVYQRPMARKVKDIGAWQRSFQALCTFSIMTNCALLCLYPESWNIVIGTSPTERFFYFVVLEHILLGLRQILHYAIPDKPEWVRVGLARENYISKKALKTQRQLKSHSKGVLTPMESKDIF